MYWFYNAFKGKKTIQIMNCKYLGVKVRDTFSGLLTFRILWQSSASSPSSPLPTHSGLYVYQETNKTGKNIDSTLTIQSTKQIRSPNDCLILKYANDIIVCGPLLFGFNQPISSTSTCVDMIAKTIIPFLLLFNLTLLRFIMNGQWVLYVAE